MSDNPYLDLDDHHFWRRAVAGVERFRLDPVVEARFAVAADERVATAGSCFAQHISRKLAEVGFNHLFAEDAPSRSEAGAEHEGAGIFSARYGPIYTSRQLWQLFQECFANRLPAEAVWTRADGRFVDALRPRIPPGGFATADEVASARRTHLEAVRRMFRECRVFVFTFGQTECWRSRIDGTVFPLAPGVAGGQFDPQRHEFVNLSIHDVLQDMTLFLAGLKSVNPGVRVLLTVSPVPLIATYEPQHVLTATTYSKAVLRVAAEMLKQDHDWVDYFPSYEIITGNYAHSFYYESDYRQVNELGIEHVMRCFVRHFTHAPARGHVAPRVVHAIGEEGDIICDEEAIVRSVCGPAAARGGDMPQP